MTEVEIDQEYADALIPEVVRRAPGDPLLFWKSLIIPSARGPLLFGDCIEDFQLEFFAKLVPSLLALVEFRKPPIRRFWLERTKKASKDADCAAILIWAMAFCKRPLKVQVSAANRKQAGIIENRAREILHYNPWLKDLVEIVQGVIRSKSNPKEIWVHIEATDAQGAEHGETPDILLLNELVHVKKWQAMKDHMANADGVPRGIVIVATNAGMKNTQAWTWRRIALENPRRWYFQSYSKVAPWIGKSDVKEAKKRDPIGSEYARLWKGIWLSGAGTALTDAEIEACFCMDGPLLVPEPGFRYLGGLDLGISKDHAGKAIIGVNKDTQEIRVALVRGFVPTLPNLSGHLEVEASDVEEDCLQGWKDFNIGWFGFDPAAGGAFMAQSLRKKGVPMQAVNYASSTEQTAMAVALVQAVKNGNLKCYDDPEGRLRRDFGKFSIEHRPPKAYKLIAVADEFGHADVGFALVLMLPRAMEELKGVGWFRSDDDVVMNMDEEEELEEEEVEEMSDELREIYELDEDRY